MQSVIHPERLAFFCQLLNCVVNIADHKAFRKIYPMCFSGADAVARMQQIPDFACYTPEAAVRLCQELLRRRYFIKARPLSGFSLSEVPSTKEALKESFSEKELYQFSSLMYLSARPSEQSTNLVLNPQLDHYNDGIGSHSIIKRGNNNSNNFNPNNGSYGGDFDDDYGGRDEILRMQLDSNSLLPGGNENSRELSTMGSRSQRRGSTSVFMPPSAIPKHAGDLLDGENSSTPNDPYLSTSYSSRQHHQQIAEQAHRHQLHAAEPVPIYVGLEGVLEKRRKKKFQMAMFQQRYFKLDVKSKCITYSSSSDAPFPLGYILLSDIVEVRKWPDKKGRFDVISSERIYVLRAETDDLAVRWVKGLNAARKDTLNGSGWFRKRPELPSLNITPVPTIFTFAFDHGLRIGKPQGQTSNQGPPNSQRPISAAPPSISQKQDHDQNNASTGENSTTVNPNERRRSISSMAQPSTTTGGLFKKSANYMSKVQANERRLQHEQRLTDRRAEKAAAGPGGASGAQGSDLAPTIEEDDDAKSTNTNAHQGGKNEETKLSRSPSELTNNSSAQEGDKKPEDCASNSNLASPTSPTAPPISAQDLELYYQQAATPLPFGRFNLGGKFILLSGYRNPKVYQLNLSFLRIQFYQITFSLTSLEHHNYLSLLLERFATDEHIIQYLYELILLPSESTEDLNDLSYLRYSFLDKDKYSLQSLQFTQYQQQHNQLYALELDALKKSAVVEYFLLKPYQGRFASAYESHASHQQQYQLQPYSTSTQSPSFLEKFAAHMSSVPYLARPDDPTPQDPCFVQRFCDAKISSGSSFSTKDQLEHQLLGRPQLYAPTPVTHHGYINTPNISESEIARKQLIQLHHYQEQQSQLAEMLTPILSSITKNYAIPEVAISKIATTPQLVLPNFPQPINSFEFTLPTAPPAPLSYPGVTTLRDPNDGSPIKPASAGTSSPPSSALASPVQPQSTSKLTSKQKFRNVRASVCEGGPGSPPGGPGPSPGTAPLDNIFSDTANFNPFATDPNPSPGFAPNANPPINLGPPPRRVQHRRAMSDILVEISDKFYDPDGLLKASPDFKFNLVFPDATPAFRASIDCPARLTYNCGNTPPGSSPEVYLRSNNGRRRASEAGLSTLILTQPSILTPETQLAAQQALQILNGPKGILSDSPGGGSSSSGTTTAIAAPSVVIPMAGANAVRFQASTNPSKSASKLSTFESTLEKPKFVDFVQSDPLFNQDRNVYSFITPRTQYNMHLQRYRVLYESVVKLNSFKTLPLRKRALMWLFSPSFPHALCSNFPSLGSRLGLPFAWLWFQSLAHNSHYHSALIDETLDRTEQYLQHQSQGGPTYGMEYNVLANNNAGLTQTSTAASGVLARTTVLQLLRSILSAERVHQQPQAPHLLIQTSAGIHEHIFNSFNASTALAKEKASLGQPSQRVCIAFQLIDWLVDAGYADTIAAATNLAKVLYTYKIIVPFTTSTQSSNLGSAHYHHYSTLSSQTGNSTYVNGLQYDKSLWFIKTDDQLFGLLPLWQQYQVLVQHHVKILNHSLLSTSSHVQRDQQSTSSSTTPAPTPTTNTRSVFPAPTLAGMPSVSVTSSASVATRGQSGVNLQAYTPAGAAQPTPSAAFAPFSATSLMVTAISLDNQAMSDQQLLHQHFEREKQDKVRSSWFGNTSLAVLIGNLSDDHWKFRTNTFCRACHKGAQNFLHLVSYYSSEFCCAPLVSNLLHQPLGDWVRVYNYIPFTELRDQALVHSLVTLLSQPIETILYHAQDNCTDQFQYVARPIPNPTVWKPLILKLYGTSIFIRAKVLYNFLFTLSGTHCATLSSQPGWCDWVMALLDDVVSQVAPLRHRPWELYHDPSNQYVRYNGSQLPESIILPSESVYLNVFHYSVAMIARCLSELYSNSSSTERLWPQFHQLVLPVSSVNTHQFGQDFNTHINIANAPIFLQATEYWNALSTTAAQLNVQQLQSLQEHYVQLAQQQHSQAPFIQDPMVYQHVLIQARESGFGPLSSPEKQGQLTISATMPQIDPTQAQNAQHLQFLQQQQQQPQISMAIGAATIQQMQSQAGELIPITLFPWYANRFNLPLACIGIASSLRPYCYRSQLKDAVLSALSRSTPEDYLLPRQIIDTQLAGLTNRANDKRSHRIHQHLPQLLYVLLMVRSFVFGLPLRLDKEDVGDCEAIQTHGQFQHYLESIYSGPVFHCANVFDAHSQPGNTNAGYTPTALALQSQVPKASAIFTPTGGPLQNHRDNIYSLQNQLSIPPYAFFLGRHETGAITKEQLTSNPAMFEYYEGRGLVWERAVVVGVQSMFDDKSINSSKYDDMWINLHWREPYGLDQDIELLDRALKLILLHRFVELESSSTTSAVLQQSISSLNAASINPSDYKDGGASGKAGGDTGKKGGGDEDDGDNGNSGLILHDAQAVWESFLTLEPDPIKSSPYDLHAIRQIQLLAGFFKDSIAFLSIIRDQVVYLTPKQIHLVMKEFVKGGSRKKIFVHKFE